MRPRLLTSVVFAAALVGGVAPGPAEAQPPSNDSFAGASAVSTPPFSATLDTSRATNDSDDAEVLAGCGNPVPAAATTVWYVYTPSADQIVTLDAQGSTYPVGVGVVTGAPGSFSVVSCFGGVGSFPAVAGQTYYLDLGDIGGGSGGTLAFTITALLRPDLVFSVDRFGRIDPTGLVTVAGRATCTPETAGQAFTSLFQQRGHAETVSAFRFTELICDGTSHPWSVPLVGSGSFKPGHAKFEAEASACNVLDCRQVHFEQTITLRKR